MKSFCKNVLHFLARQGDNQFLAHQGEDEEDEEEEDTEEDEDTEEEDDSEGEEEDENDNYRRRRYFRTHLYAILGRF